MSFKYLYIETLAYTAVYLLIFTLLFLFSKIVLNRSAALDTDEKFGDHDNHAVSLTMSGYYLAVAIIFAAALYGPSKGFALDILAVVSYSLLGILLLNLSRYFNDKVIFNQAHSITTMCRQHNTAVGAAQFGAYLATGLIVAASISGQGGGAISALVFFVLGQLSLFLFNKIYDWITPFDIREHLMQQNLACGIALSGTLVALGMIIANGIRGDFVSWRVDITSFVIAVTVACFFLPIVRLFMNHILIRNANLSSEISDNQNIGAALLEAFVAISFSLVLTQIV